MNILATVPRSSSYDEEVRKLVKHSIVRSKWRLGALYSLFTLPLIVSCFVPQVAHSFSPITSIILMLLPVIVASSILLGVWLRSHLFNYLSIDGDGVLRPLVRILGLWFWRPTQCEIIKDRLFPHFNRLVVFHKKKVLFSMPIDDAAKATELINAFELVKRRESTFLKPSAT